MRADKNISIYSQMFFHKLKKSLVILEFKFVMSLSSNLKSKIFMTVFLSFFIRLFLGLLKSMFNGRGERLLGLVIHNQRQKNMNFLKSFSLLFLFWTSVASTKKFSAIFFFLLPRLSKKLAWRKYKTEKVLLLMFCNLLTLLFSLSCWCRILNVNKKSPIYSVGSLI